MIDSKVLLGNGIKRLRESKGLSQESFSELIDISMQAISQIERGTRFTSSETIDKICNLYNITPEKLFSGDELFFHKNQPDCEEHIKDILTMLNCMEAEKIRVIKELVKVIYDRTLQVNYID